MKPCYHCRRHPARENSRFCSECNPRPLFFPTERKRGRCATGLLYTGAAVATVWALVKAMEAYLQP